MDSDNKYQIPDDELQMDEDLIDIDEYDLSLIDDPDLKEFLKNIGDINE